MWWMSRVEQDAYDRVQAVIENSRHLRGGGRVLDLSLHLVEILSHRVRRLEIEVVQHRDVIMRMQTGDLAPWCVRLRNRWWRMRSWVRRAIT